MLPVILIGSSSAWPSLIVKLRLAASKADWLEPSRDEIQRLEQAEDEGQLAEVAVVETGLAQAVETSRVAAGAGQFDGAADPAREVLVAGQGLGVAGEVSTFEAQAGAVLGCRVELDLQAATDRAAEQLGGDVAEHGSALADRQG